MTEADALTYARSLDGFTGVVVTRETLADRKRQGYTLLGGRLPGDDHTYLSEKAGRQRREHPSDETGWPFGRWTDGERTHDVVGVAGRSAPPGEMWITADDSGLGSIGVHTQLWYWRCP